MTLWDVNAFYPWELVGKLPLQSLAQFLPLFTESINVTLRIPEVSPELCRRTSSAPLTVAHCNHDPLLDKLPRCIQKHGLSPSAGKTSSIGALKARTVNRSAVSSCCSLRLPIAYLFFVNSLLNYTGIDVATITNHFSQCTNLISTDHLFIVETINDCG